MAEGEVRRKLAAILYADVAAYSRLTGADEEGTHKTLSAYLDAMAAAIEGHDGRVVHYAGDAVLAEFRSVVAALACAVEIQKELGARNAEVPDERKVQFRIGVNLGEVIVDRDDIYGDGVNVAARLESLADPGGICVSGKVYEETRNRLEVAFEEMGAQSVKNITEPVPAYRVILAAGEAGSAASAAEQTPALALPDKPSIAVLPFQNMSGDAEQEYFSDGITEDTITELSRFTSLFVIARSSSFAYKGKSPNIQDVGRELGVAYVLEGSVRKAGTRVRITAQLLDTSNGAHVWAERYDRELEDIFAVQDEITEIIVATLPGRLEALDLERAKRKATENMAAYDYLLRGKDHHHRVTKEDNALALEMLDKTIELDPSFAQAYAWRACTLGQAWSRGFIEDPDWAWNQIGESLERARSLDEDDCEVHRLFADVHLIKREFDQALAHQERALSLNPNDPRMVSQHGEILTWMGRADEGVEWQEKTLRLDPVSEDRRRGNLAQALFVARRYQDAIDTYKRVVSLTMQRHAYLAACHAYLDHCEDAKAHAAEVLKLAPDFSVHGHLEKLPYMNQADLVHHREGLLKAGLPA